MPHPVFHPGLPDWFPDLAETLGEPKSKIKFVGVHITRAQGMDPERDAPPKDRLLYHVILSGLAGDWVPKPWDKQPWSEAVEELAKNEFAIGCAKWAAEQFGGAWYGTVNSAVGEQRSLSASDRLMCAVTNHHSWHSADLEPEAKVRLLKLATNTALGESQAIHTAPRSDLNDSESSFGNQLLERQEFPLDLADFSRLKAALAEEGAILQSASVSVAAHNEGRVFSHLFKIAYTPTQTLADKIKDGRNFGIAGGIDTRKLQKMFGITQLWLMPDKGIAGLSGPSASGLWTVYFWTIDMTGEWAKVVNKTMVKNSLVESALDKNPLDPKDFEDDEDEIMDEESAHEKSNLFREIRAFQPHHLDPIDFEHLKQALSERVILKKAYVLASWLGRPLAVPELRLRYKPVVKGDWCDSWLGHKLCEDDLQSTARLVLRSELDGSQGFSAFAVDCLRPQWLKMAYKGVVKSRINFGRT